MAAPVRGGLIASLRPIKNHIELTRHRPWIALNHQKSFAVRRHAVALEAWVDEILDEPTEGLDPLMQRAFYEILDTLKAEGRTIFFSSHVLSEVERVCDRVAIVREGRLVALEETARLLARRKRNILMRFTGPPPSLEMVSGITNVEYGNGYLTCRVEGSVRPFLAAIANAAIEDLTIEPARLEEAFLELYDEVEST
jgi:beta-exotoxin I transport system ATP-binding protein